jgi:acetoin utilization deacetylase AcuC-like enzyme
MWKPRGSLDIGLPDGAHDAAFLDELGRALPAVMAHRPQCVFYLAGADPYEDDQLGGLRLTKAGLLERDRVVIDAVRAVGVPLVIVLAGGRAPRRGTRSRFTPRYRRGRRCGAGGPPPRLVRLERSVLPAVPTLSS